MKQAGLIALGILKEGAKLAGVVLVMTVIVSAVGELADKHGKGWFRTAFKSLGKPQATVAAEPQAPAPVNNEPVAAAV